MRLHCVRSSSQDSPSSPPRSRRGDLSSHLYVKSSLFQHLNNQTPCPLLPNRVLKMCFVSYTEHHKFSLEFIVASVSVPIISTDFFCAHGMLGDIANRRIIDAVTFATVLCAAGRSGPVIRAHFMFPSLTTPAFPFTVAKDRLAHFIPTEGLPVYAWERFLDAAKLEEFATAKYFETL